MTLQVETFSKYDWLEQVFRKSESERSANVARVSLKMFDFFCQNEGLIEPKMIERYQALAKEGDIRSICLSLDKFVQFLNQDHDDIELNSIGKRKFKKKSFKTIENYFSFIKSYLRKCHGVKLTSEDIKDYVTFPRRRKEQRRAIPLNAIKLILAHATPLRDALYLVLISSGMRIGECLALTKADFHFNENPVRITIRAETTKTKEKRDTFISSEAYDKLKPFIEGKEDDEKVFTDYDDNYRALLHEERYFSELRQRIGESKKIKNEDLKSLFLERYQNSNRFIINIHAFRAYFHTKASQKHGSDYANALDGHGAYLKQYYRETPEERAKKYNELEPNLLIESIKLEAEKTKDKIIEDLQAEMEKLKDQMLRIELLNNNP